MTNQTRQVFFVVSTAGHVRGFVELAEMIQRSGLAQPTILAFPSDPMRDIVRAGRAQINELVWRGDGFVERSQLSRSNNADYCWLVSIADSGVRRILHFLSPAINSLVFGGALACNFIAKSLTRFAAPGRLRAATANEPFMRKVFFDTLAYIWDLKRFLPSYTTRYIGAPIHFIAQSIFFGFWSRHFELEAVTSMFCETRPSLIVLPEQNFGYHHEILFSAAKRYGVPVLIFPYSLAGHQEWAENFKEMPECHVRGLLRRAVARSFPLWVLPYKGHRLILPLPYIFSCEYLRCVPTIPWVTNSGPDGTFAADNLFMKEFYHREGVDTSEWQTVGSLAEDRLFRNMSRKDVIRQTIASRLALDPDLPILLIGLPPEQFTLGVRPGMEFGNYRELVEFIVSETVVAAENKYNIWVSLHPRTRREDVEFIEAKSVRIIDGPVEEILPVAHTYISVISATIRWAVACEVPVLNFDAYQAHYDDYTDLAGVVEVRTKEKFRLQISLMTQDATYHSRLTQAQAEDARRLFKLDGKAEERICQLISELCDTQQSKTLQSAAQE